MWQIPSAITWICGIRKTCTLPTATPGPSRSRSTSSCTPRRAHHQERASIFLQQKLKVVGAEERGRIVDAMCARAGETMMHRFGNCAVQRCLEAATGPEERRKIVACMRGRVVDLATNCYGCHVLQKALDCEEEEVRLLILSELLMGDPAQMPANKHASHVWSKVYVVLFFLSPPLYHGVAVDAADFFIACLPSSREVADAYPQRERALKDKSRATRRARSSCSAFETLEESARDGLLGPGGAVFGEVAKSAYCVQRIRARVGRAPLAGPRLEYATNEQGSKSVMKASTVSRTRSSVPVRVHPQAHRYAARVLEGHLPLISTKVNLTLFISSASYIAAKRLHGRYSTNYRPLISSPSTTDLKISLRSKSKRIHPSSQYQYRYRIFIQIGFGIGIGTVTV
ncbi:armadillo-type protein [Mycena galericulata]|nr:armadillo-type protein [Mycena galericulata]